ncbi:MAG: hypothetical protein JWO63_2856, partial [Frankiales bacterium]|nr:hypothetical protein [Frankiales bacterium]
QRRAVLVLAICGLIGLVMSFGPSLKIDDTRPPTTGNPTAQSYLMPKADATLSLPTALLDENAPGFSLMRATYRWFVLTRWALIALAALGVQQLISRALRSRRPWPALIVIVALGVLSVLELLPNPSQTLHNYRAWENERKQTLAVATDLKHSLPAGSKVAFLVGTSAANDYLANLLVPAAGLRSYNVGVDKSVAISSASWPKEIRQLIQGPNASGALGPALHDGLVNAVIIPKFDLRWSSYSWPPAVEYQQRGIALATQVSANPDFKVVDHKWFYIVTLRQ